MWQTLKDFDAVHLVAPSGAPVGDNVSEFQSLLSSYKINTVLPADYLDVENAPYKYYANSDAMRTKFFKQALMSDEKVIWALRGGFGAQAVLRNLRQDAAVAPKFQKLFCGFSDETLLGLGLYEMFGWPYLHGNCYCCAETAHIGECSGKKDGTSIVEMLDIIKGVITQVSIELSPLNNLAQSMDIPNTVVLGGNFAVIQRNLSGLLAGVNWAGKILLIEDTIEDPKRAQDMLLGMLDTGRFDEIKGIIFGDYPLFETPLEDFINQVNIYLDFKKLKLPIYHNFMIGHGPYNKPIPMGTAANITVINGRPMLEIQTNSPTSHN